MQLRFAAALLTLALPALAQTPAATDAETVFYKAFWLEKGEHDSAGAMALYEKFLAMAPDHPKAKFAAQSQLVLLNRAGQTKEAEAFAQKYGKLLGGATAGGPPDAGAAPRGEGAGPAGAGGGRRGPGGAGAGAGGRTPPTPEQIKELETKLAKAKEEGKTEEVAQLERQLQRAKQGAEGGGRGMRGQGGGQGGGRRGGIMAETKKFADMTPEELTQFQQGMDRMSGQIDRLRENGMEDRAKALEEGIAAIKKALADKKLDEAQKALDKLREGRRGGGGK